jgi:hypothetical protein
VHLNKTLLVLNENLWREKERDGSARFIELDQNDEEKQRYKQEEPQDDNYVSTSRIDINDL